ncbi:MAG TPA: hypothetical protein PLB49_08715 [Chitinophagaceae bacterium]|nr:hypothetical protein [Chitinophagaceae bacterium]
MKKIALFILLLFATVQVIPGMQALFSDRNGSVIFNVDEEKNGEKTVDTSQKINKEYSDYCQLSAILSQRLLTAFHLSEQILPAPSLERLTPPPNY